MKVSRKCHKHKAHASRGTERRKPGYKTFFMLNSAEHENFTANNYENANF